MPTTSQPSAAPAAPSVTVAVTRRADPSRSAEMAAWVRAGASLAETFPGFLGAGSVRPRAGSGEWHMLYRFADAAALAAWERSEQRAWWLASAAGIAELAATERRTGFEGWFEAPGAAPDDAPARAAAPESSAPPRWKQAVAIWCGFFPTSLGLGYALAGLVPDAAVWERALLSTLAATPLMTYLVMPAVTRVLAPWLRPRER